MGGCVPASAYSSAVTGCYLPQRDAMPWRTPLGERPRAESRVWRERASERVSAVRARFLFSTADRGAAREKRNGTRFEDENLRTLLRSLNGISSRAVFKPRLVSRGVIFPPSTSTSLSSSFFSSSIERASLILSPPLVTSQIILVGRSVARGLLCDACKQRGPPLSLSRRGRPNRNAGELRPVSLDAYR